ncbi:MAG: hypothetical protein CM1200mP18_11120 [Gammaproteobacteria bacterium]|nr:MAG: hypothetical protein CM1200mP18_11120 [Gammaproteobacteria bacterium]
MTQRHQQVRLFRSGEIRRITAERLSTNWGVAPHVSEGIEVDFSRFESYRVEREADWLGKMGYRVWGPMT